ncbi:hypothetical protein ILUMI_14847, partial [Ignelater luminosus]
ISQHIRLTHQEYVESWLNTQENQVEKSKSLHPLNNVTEEGNKCNVREAYSNSTEDFDIERNVIIHENFCDGDSVEDKTTILKKVAVLILKVKFWSRTEIIMTEILVIQQERDKISKPQVAVTVTNSRKRTTWDKPKDCTIVEKDIRGNHSRHQTVKEPVKDSVRQHINSFQQIVLHYLRVQTTREFVDGPMFHIYETYKSRNHKEKEGQEPYNRHIKNKAKSREEKEKNVVLSKENNNVIVANFDLQAVLPTPCRDISTFFYKCRLNCFNFTVFEITSKNGY